MAKRKNIEADRLKKRDAWVERTIRVTGYERSAAEKLLKTPRTQSFRLNPLVASATQGQIQQDYAAKEIIWNGVTVGYTCEQNDMGRLRKSESATNGEVYIQNAASWLPVLALDPKPDETILDVCAAPGGKSSHIQVLTNNMSKLTCNDNSKPRLMKLQRNMERLGADATYTLCDATRLSRTFKPETFDKILIDRSNSTPLQPKR